MKCHSYTPFYCAPGSTLLEARTCKQPTTNGGEDLRTRRANASARSAVCPAVGSQVGKGCQQCVDGVRWHACTAVARATGSKAAP